MISFFGLTEGVQKRLNLPMRNTLLVLFLGGLCSPGTVQAQTLDLKKLSWSGDLRYRLAEAKEKSDDRRLYQQLRARLGLKAEVNESVQAIFRLATATSAISSNQTLGDSSNPGMTRRSFGLDWAYLDWKFLSAGKFWAGRTANPFWSPAKTQLVFDSDLAFEGLALKWEPKWSHSGAFANLGGFVVAENYSAPNDAIDTGLIGAEVGYNLQTLTLHIANYHFLNIVDRQITTIESSAKVDSYSQPFDRYRGNTVYLNGPGKYHFSHQYVLWQGGVEFKFDVGPVQLVTFYDYVLNEKVGRQREGRELGVSAKLQRWSLAVARVEKDADAVVGAFTDSDTNGGGTDNQGWRYQLGILAGPNTSFALTHYDAKRGVGAVERDYRATHADLVVSF